MTMNLRVKQSTSFKKSVKKLSRQQKKILDEVVSELMKDPTLGERKKSDLDFLRVHKFKFSHQEILLGYMYIEKELILALLSINTPLPACMS
jgi:mRNA-degrading endonuclease RelE of RelBE toxin-antitoxin system